MVGLVAVGWAHADGCFVLPPDPLTTHTGSSSAQKGILIREGADEVLLLQTTYHGPASRFAWIIPVPVKPRVFLAEPTFLNEVFAGSEPQVTTDLGATATLPQLLNVFGTFGGREKAAGAPGGPPPPEVRVLQRMALGNLDASVLASTDGSALRKWLLANRYAMPEDRQDVLGSYARQGWVFVALRVQDKAAASTPMLADAPPVGLRFAYPAGKLVFPLTISRLSAPAQTAILLCTIGEAPYLCETLPTRFIDRPVRLRRGETYGNVRRTLTRQPVPGTLCEASRLGALPYSDLSYDPDHPATTNMPQARLTRHFLLLQPNEMQDLVFGARPDDPHQDYQVLISRQGRLRRAPPGYSSLESLVLEPHSPEQAAARAQAVDEPRKMAMLWSLGRTADALVIVYVVCGLALIVVFFRRGQSDVGCGMILLFLFGAVVLGGVLQSANARYRSQAELADRLMKRLEAAAVNFRTDTGASPRTVADLAAAVAPVTGYDASGNEVPVQSWHGPYLRFAPPDPTGGTALVVDPLNTQLIDAGGLTGTVEGVTQTRISELFPWKRPGTHYPGVRTLSAAPPTFWHKSKAAMQADLQPYADAIKEADPKQLWVARSASRTGHGSDCTFVINRQHQRGLAVQDPQESSNECVDVSPDGIQVRVALARSQMRGKQSWAFGCAGPDLAARCELRDEQLGSLKMLRVAPGAHTLLLQENWSSGVALRRFDGNQASTALNIGEDEIEAATFAPDGTRVYVLQRPHEAEREDATCVVTAFAVPGGKQVGRLSGVYGDIMAVGKSGAVAVTSEKVMLLARDGTTRSLCAIPRLQRVKAAALAEHTLWLACEELIDTSHEWGTVYRMPLSKPALTPVAHWLPAYQLSSTANGTANLLMCGATDISVGGVWGSLSSDSHWRRWGYWLLSNGRVENLRGQLPGNDLSGCLPDRQNMPARTDKLPVIPCPQAKKNGA